MEINNDIKNVKRIINLTLIGFILMQAYGLYLQLVKDTLTFWWFVIVAIGLFSIYSLLKARKWAKTIVTITCVTILLGSLIPGIIQIIRGSWIYAIVNILVTAWSIYLIWFLNESDRYDRYAKVVRSGFYPAEKEVSALHELISEDKLIDFDRTKIVNPIHYKTLIDNLIDAEEEIKVKIEGIRIDQSNILIETKDALYEIELEPAANFFQPVFIEKLNMVLDELDTNKLVAIIYPRTTAYKNEYKLGVLSEQEFILLKNNGMIK